MTKNPTQDHPTEDRVSLAEFAALAEVNEPTLRGYVSRGLAPEADIGWKRGRLWWKRETVDKFLATRAGKGRHRPGCTCKHCVSRRKREAAAVKAGAVNPGTAEGWATLADQRTNRMHYFLASPVSLCFRFHYDGSDLETKPEVPEDHEVLCSICKRVLARRTGAPA